MRQQFALDLNDELAIDNFAGGGGASMGIENALGRHVDHAINHDSLALGMHRINHPQTVHHTSDVFDIDPLALTEGRRVGLGWFSPDCFPAGTLILTDRGYRKIETVKVGDRVLTHRQRWRKVTETHRTIRPLITIRAHGHPGLSVSPEHPFLARRRAMVWNNSKRREMPTMTDADWAPAGLLQGGTYRYHYPNGTRAILDGGWYWASPTKFPKLPCPLVSGRGMKIDADLMWLAGRYVGDGWTRLTSTRAELVITCGKHEVEKLRPLLNRWSRKGWRSGENELAWHERATGTAYQFTTSHRGLVEWLRSEFSHRAENKGIPGWALGAEENLRRALLEGYLSADGSRKGNVVECSTVSKALAFGVKALVNSLGWTASIYLQENSGTIQGREVNARPVYVVRWRAKLEVKQTFHDAGLEWSPIRDNQRLTDRAEVFNFGVEEDESYVAEGVIVHNCKHFSKAKGGRPLDKKIRGLVLVILKWAKIRTRVAYMENVEEIRTWGPLLHHKKHAADCNCGKPCGMPDPKHKGRTWKAFLDALSTGLDPDHPDMPEILEVLAGSVTKEELVRGFGYHYELREIRACTYGIPTIRKRLFMIARCDGMPIVWPPDSHFDPKVWPPDSKFGQKSLRANLKPYRIIAECIDWDRPCPSIFLTKIQARKHRCRRPLKTPTMRRVATGIGRYVMHSVRPFIISLTHQGGDRTESVDEPAKTVTGAHRGEKALVDASLAPFITEHANASSQRNMPIDEPGRTQCGEVKGGHFALVAAQVVGCGGRAGQSRPRGTDEPIHALTTKADNCLVSAHLMRNFGQSVGQAVDAPAPTTMPNGGGKTALISGTLVRTAHGDQDKKGKKRGRGSNDLRESMPTVLGTQEFAFAAAHLTKFNTGSVGSPMDQPAPTIPAGNHSPETHGGAATVHGLVAASMVKLRGNAKTHAPGSTADSPGHVISAGGEHHALSCAYLAQHNAGNNSNPGHPATEPISTVSQKGAQQQVVSASLAAYYGSEADGQGIDESLRAVTTKPRFGLAVSEAVTPGLTPDQIAGARRVAKFLRKFGVKFEGEFATVGEFIIVDIGMRMLTPRELFRAQGFPEDYVIDRAWLVNPKTGEIVEVKLTKESQIRMCGNSVCPGVAEVLVRANNPEMVVFSPEERRTRMAEAWRSGNSQAVRTPVSCAAR